MLGFGKDARERRGALAIICSALEWEADARAGIRAHSSLQPEQSQTFAYRALAAELLAQVSKWETRIIGGRLMPKPSAAGYALEALSKSLYPPTRRPADQELLTGALTRYLAFCAKHTEKLNSTDYELFLQIGRRCIARADGDGTMPQPA